ncbi:DUF1516 family protein [Apilactobacillus apisilvae]|uniref:DUF1516 family protein n=1 Tax=Apilactobacillus apisilvae TaxID=2923364 RepID=UPI0037BFEB08
MLVSIVYIILGIYILNIIIGLTRLSAKRIIQWLIYTRITYILLFMFNIILAFRVFHNNNIEALITVLLIVSSSIMVEINYSNKQRSSLKNINVTLLIISILALIIFNLIIVLK